jgi:uncharacterized protein
MILYADTSALVKLHVYETGSAHVRIWSDQASCLVTSLVTYVESRAAFARLHRLGGLSTGALREVVTRFEHDWSRYEILGVDEALTRRAGALAERHGLRGYDAIQLVTALEARPRVGTLVFACFDDRLNRAAVREGLALPPEPDLVADRPRAVRGRQRVVAQPATGMRVT